jgi:protein-S-isoprenylcysteine O-methyltransferase Ste14
VAIFPPALLALCLVGGAVAHALLGWRLAAGPSVRAAGGLLAAVSIAVAIWGERTMTAAGTNVRPDMPTTAIVAAGPFAVSRNPLYLSMIGLHAGIGIALASPPFLLFVLPLALVLRYGVIAREEAYLAAKFGGVYRDYRSRVRRWI